MSRKSCKTCVATCSKYPANRGCKWHQSWREYVREGLRSDGYPLTEAYALSDRIIREHQEFLGSGKAEKP